MFANLQPLERYQEHCAGGVHCCVVQKDPDAPGLSVPAGTPVARLPQEISDFLNSITTTFCQGMEQFKVPNAAGANPPKPGTVAGQFVNPMRAQAQPAADYGANAPDPEALRRQRYAKLTNQFVT